MNWNKVDTRNDRKVYISDDGKYAITSEHRYYINWEPCYLPNGIKGEWIGIDGLYKGKGALATAKSVCAEHRAKQERS